MSKVIHLSDHAHHKAKAFCREHCLKMSDWVASLIDAAIVGGISQVPPLHNNVRALVQKKKLVAPHARANGGADVEADVGAAPPFWQHRARR